MVAETHLPTTPAVSSEELRRLVVTLVDHVGIARTREIAREHGLLGRDAKRLDTGMLKRRLPDAGTTARELAHALQDRARVNAAVNTLRRMAHESLDAPRVDPRARTCFRKAQSAINDGDRTRLDRLTEQLTSMHREFPHDSLLTMREVVLASLSGNAMKLRAALERLPISTPPQPSSIDITPPAHTDGTLGGSTGIRNPTESPTQAQASPSPSLSHGRSGTEATNSEFGSPTRVDDLILHIREAMASRVTEARAALARPMWSETTINAYARLRVSLSGLPDTPVAGSDRFLTSAREAVTRATDALRDLEGAFIADTNVHVEAIRGAVRWIGSDARVDDLPSAADVVSSAEAQLIEVEAAAARVVESLVSALSSGATLDAAALNRALASVTSGACSLVEVARELHTIVQAARSQVSEETRRTSDAPLPESSASLGFDRAAKLAQPFPSSTLLSSRLGADVVGRDLRGSRPYFLPADYRLDEPIALLKPPADASQAVVATCAAANLIRGWAVCLADQEPISRLLTPISDGSLILDAVRGDRHAEVLAKVVVGLAMHAVAGDRDSARARRRLRALLAVQGDEQLTPALHAMLQHASDAPGFVHASAELLRHGFGDALVHAIATAALKDIAVGRSLLAGLATALVALDSAETQRLRTSTLLLLGLPSGAAADVDDYLEDVDERSRKGQLREPPEAAAAWPPLAIDLVNALAARIRERGRDRRGQASLTVSVLKAAQSGVPVAPGACQVEIPLLVRNKAPTAAAAIAITLEDSATETPPVQTANFEALLPWITDEALRDTASLVIAANIDVDPELIGSRKELKLAARTSWLGGQVAAEILTVPLLHDAAEPPPREIRGYGGEPVDLNDPEVLDVSSQTVRDCFTKLRDRLRKGLAVRAVICGRRRRGKSSISTSLNKDEEILAHFTVRLDIYDGPRITSLAAAFGRLAEQVRRALASANVRTPSAPNFDDLTRAADISSRYLAWIEEACAAASSPVRILLLLDEFQKWIVGLGSMAERQAILGALRRFNQGNLGKVDVSFVLSGLRNLKQLVDESTDLAAAVDRFEVLPMNQRECKQYVARRLPIETDDRTRLRLAVLSGGNPFVLNRLGGSLLEHLQRKRRSWCTTADVEALLAERETSDGRLDAYIQYMLREDEDEGAPTLRELTVLRAAASVLARRADYAGYVRVEEVEAWLREREVPFDPGQPAHQLATLVSLGLLGSRDLRRFSLQEGEWLCRQLAALGPDRAELLPVTVRSDIDLVLGRYRKKRQLDAGGQAEIWLAENVEDRGCDVVLKIYPRGSLDVLRRIERERELLTRIDHPSVVRCHGANMDEHHGGVVVLEYVNARDLRSLIEERPVTALAILPGGKLDVQIALFKDIADAIAACHAAGVIHKDLSPGNVMLALRGGLWEPVIVDFGLASADDDDATHTQNVGTPGYVAPEKLRGGRRSKPADVYALGVMLTAVITGLMPEAGRWSKDLVLDLLRERECPAKLIRLIGRMLDDDPALRPTAAETRADIESCLLPDSWINFHHLAVECALNDRKADAITNLHRALASVPPDECHGKDYIDLLNDAADISLHDAPERVTFIPLLFAHWLRALQAGILPADAGSKLVGAVETYTKRIGRGPEDLLVEAIRERTPDQAFAPLVMQLAQSQTFPASDKLFDVLASFVASELVPRPCVERYCVRASHELTLRKSVQIGQLWLQRARRLGLNPTHEYLEQEERLAQILRRTNRLHTMPAACKEQRGAVIGESERGHLHVAQIEQFASRVSSRFPWICQIKRVTKDSGVHVSRPTLLRIDQIASHLPNGTSDPGNIIPIVLDGSFTPERIPLRMNVILEPKTTAAQRETAHGILRDAEDLFDCHRD
ncbi:protein kinase domain-containing protein [Sorangium sp. So ce542]|uniref:protein kinase domain-containing protein n=1 Tax=Sorangium sp. So ce542 TaxID=3133316 RepID=UPI003F632677